MGLSSYVIDRLIAIIVWAESARPLLERTERAARKTLPAVFSWVVFQSLRALLKKG